MARARLATVAVATMLAGAVVIAAAPGPRALDQASPGLWEIGGLPGVKAPARECVSDPVALAKFEHRSKKCDHKVLTASGSSTLVDYKCGGRDFGRSKLTMLTPRSVRIETQGISDGMPFNYVLQARRVGECPIKAAVAAH